MLAMDDQPGLQLYTKSNKWIDVRPIPVLHTLHASMHLPNVPSLISIMDMDGWMSNRVHL
jgi:hypothetical protein